MVSVERFFLMYAFPCGYVLLDSGDVNKKDYDLIEACARGGSEVSRKMIEEFFTGAFRRIKRLAGEMEVEDYWDRRVIELYWYGEHNRVIDEGDGGYSRAPESFCDFCKVHVARVLEILPDGFLLVGYRNKERVVNGEYVFGVGVGEEVRIHHAYAVEKFREVDL